MKKFSVLLALLFIIGTSHSQIKFEKGSLADVISKAKSENKVLMVDVLTDWCKWCIELDNKVYSSPQVYEFANAKQVNYKIDAEKGEGIDFANKYKVNGYPTILFLDGNGNEIDRLIGYYPAKDFYEMMVDYNKGINTFKALNAALGKDPNDIPANLKLADKYMSYGELDSARVHLNKIIEIDPKNLSGKTDDAKYKIASLSKKDDIIQNLESFINEYPESEMLKNAYISLAESCFMVNNDIPSAERYFKEVISRFPDDEYVNISYGEYLNGRAFGLMNDTNSTEEDYKKGLTLIDEALSYTKSSVNEGSSYFIQSKLFFNLKEYSKALISIDKAIEIFDRKLYRDHRQTIMSIVGPR